MRFFFTQKHTNYRDDLTVGSFFFGGEGGGDTKKASSLFAGGIYLDTNKLSPTFLWVSKFGVKFRVGIKIFKFTACR